MKNNPIVNADINKEKCPLCDSADIKSYYADSVRAYLQCARCYLVFVPSIYFICRQEEKQRYDLHQNSPDDMGYRKFLGRMFCAMQKILPPHSRGFDFGCGPGPTLSLMFEEAGHKMAVFDYFYAQDNSVFEKQYDFITATEVLEHLHHPRRELDRLWSCLKPGGRLGIMTKLVLDKEAFSGWHYVNDMTHVCFFHEKTFRWIADRWQADFDFMDNDITFFYKREKG